MNNFFENHEVLSSILLTIMVFIGICVPASITQLPKHHYEDIDLDNNKGIAKECSYKFQEYKSGGQGSPVCELEDGTIKLVKEYKYILEKGIDSEKNIYK